MALAHQDVKPDRSRMRRSGTDMLAAFRFATGSSSAAQVAGPPQGWGPSGKGNHGFDHRPCNRVIFEIDSPSGRWRVVLFDGKRENPPNSLLMNLSHEYGRGKEESDRDGGRGMRRDDAARLPCVIERVEHPC